MRSPYVIAFLNPLNLAMLALSVAAGLCSAWWLFPLGLLLWLVMFLLVARNPVMRVALKQEARSGALSPRFQAVFDDVTRAQTRLFTTLQSADDRTQAVFAPVQDAVEALVDEVYIVCQRMTGPENFRRVSTLNTDLEGERALAVLAMESAADPKEKAEKQEQVRAIEERMKSIRAVETLLNRVETQVKTVANELQATLAELVRLQALGVKEAEQQVPTLARRIRRQIEELKEFEREAAKY
ncbi:MAG: hypothetical protein RMK99_03615 [Anaerolineales bacterium]|nr:hypothetical protein [Anaerolineales bacterium]